MVYGESLKHMMSQKADILVVVVISNMLMDAKVGFRNGSESISEAMVREYLALPS